MKRRVPKAQYGRSKEKAKPSNEISGGAWYAQGKLLEELKEACFEETRNPTTFDVIHNRLKDEILNKLTKQQASELLTSMVLSNELIEVKSNGYGEFHSIPPGTLCYKAVRAVGRPKVGAMAAIPCGACPRISKCTPDPDGVISPATCVYFTKWLGMDISF